MLGKLIKHEFKATWMIMTLICAVLLGTGLVGGFTLRSFVTLDDITDIQTLFLSFASMFFIILLVSMALLSTVYLVVHYYRSLYTSQGYLSFTLPASITQVVSSRMIVACIWTIVSALFLAICISLIVIIGSAQYFPYVLDFFNEAVSELMEEVGSATFYRLLIQYLFIVILGLISRIMLYFFCISVGQLWDKHKILGAVIAYFATTFVLGIVSTFISVGYYGALSAFSYSDYYDLNRMLSTYMLRYFIYSLVLIVLFYVGSIVISNKKLNLD
jgi:hypothetical protein